MKKLIIFAAFFTGVFAADAQTKPQSLKDLLYSGRLKSDSGTVVRKGDDLSTKIDTTTKKTAMAEKPKATKSPENATSQAEAQTDTAATAVTVQETSAAPKSNAKIWREYSDALVSSLKSEILQSKKVKKADYYISFDYEQNTDGTVATSNVVSDPQNAAVQAAVQEHLTAAPPQFTPALDATGKPRKVKKKYSFTMSKE